MAYETIQGTAEAGEHYTFAKGRLTFDPGDKEESITVKALTPDAFQRNDKTFSVTLSSAENATISVDTATVTISEPDLPQLSFDADKTKVKEGESVTFTVSLSRPSEEKVTGKLSITTASASEGEDYNFIPSDSFTFDAGNNDDQFVQVQTLTTGPYRVNKTFTARLSSLSEDISIKPQSEEVTVTDLVLPQLSFVAESANVDLAEDEIKNLIVKLSRSSAEEVTVTYKTKAGTALADEHYVPLENTLTFAVGETQQTIEVTANKPEAFQSNEKTFFVELLSPEHATISNNDNMATVIISEPALPQLSFVADRTEVEEGESVTFTVSLSRPLLENVTGALSISSQNMKVDENYKFLPSATFTFPANETTDQTIEVKALQSETYSGDGAFTAILTSSRRDIDIVENNNRVTIEPAIPETVELTLEFIQNKNFHFTWQSSPKATDYELRENIEGTSDEPFPLIKTFDHNESSYDHIVPLYARLDAAYELKSCNSSGCSASQRVKIDKGKVENNNTTLNINDSIGLIKDDVDGNHCEILNWNTKCISESAVSLSKNGKILAVGNYTDDTMGGNAGSVKVFSLKGDIWETMGPAIHADNADTQAHFGAAVSLSDDGNILAVGAYLADGADGEKTDSGAVYVYEYNGLIWQRMGSIIYAENSGKDDLFGTSVSLAADGKTLAVGASKEGSTELDSGAAYVFIFNGENWEQQGDIIKASTPIKDNYFGRSVSLNNDGDVLAVGAPSSAAYSGGVYVFTLKSNNMWQQAGSPIKAKHADADDRFGLSISLSGDGNTFAVGALGEDNYQPGIYLNGLEEDNNSNDAYKNSGAAYVFTIDSATHIWSQEAYIKSLFPTKGDWLGWSVSLSDNGNTLAVGAYLDNSGDAGIRHKGERTFSSKNSGQVYLYTRTSSAWSAQAYIKAKNVVAGERFGASVSLSGNGETLAVGNSSTQNELRVYTY